MRSKFWFGVRSFGLELDRVRLDSEKKAIKTFLRVG